MSHRDQLSLALSILVLCVLITGVKKTDDLTEKMRLSPLLFYSASLFSFLVLRFHHTSTGCSWTKGTSWPMGNIRLMLPDADKFPYPQDAMPMFVLQVATVEGPQRSCEGAVFSPTSLLHPQQFFFLPCLSFFLSAFHPLSFSQEA